MLRRYNIDLQTLQALNQDEPKAQKCVFDNYYGGLVVSSEKKTNNHQASQEIASDALAKLFNLQPKHFTEVVQLSSWLSITVRNLSIDFLRKNKKFRNHVPYTESLSEIESQFDRIIEFDQPVFQLVIEAIKYLPQQQKQVFSHKLNGLSTRQIALLLRIQESTVNNHKCYAIKFIREFLIQRGKLLLSFDY
jgi:RNA polymerase sigma-70 factor, ECF subfamily